MNCSPGRCRWLLDHANRRIGCKPAARSTTTSRTGATSTPPAVRHDTVHRRCQSTVVAAPVLLFSGSGNATHRSVTVHDPDHSPVAEPLTGGSYGVPRTHLSNITSVDAMPHRAVEREGDGVVGLMCRLAGL